MPPPPDEWCGTLDVMPGPDPDATAPDEDGLGVLPLMTAADVLQPCVRGRTVDLAAERGGNTVGCVPHEHTITPNGVHIIGYTDLASRLPGQSSTMFSNNIHNFLKVN